MQTPPGSGDGSFNSEEGSWLWADPLFPLETYATWSQMHFNVEWNPEGMQALWEQMLQEEPDVTY